MSFPITATIEPEKLRAILCATTPHSPLRGAFVFLFVAHSPCLEPVHSTMLRLPKWIGERGLCEAYFWMAGKGKEAESAWHFLLHPSLS